jgi:WD40 repeat protein
MHEGDVRSVEFSPDGQTVLTDRRETTLPGAATLIELWDVATGRPRGDPIRLEHDDRGNAIRPVFSPDGQTILVKSSGLTTRIWDLYTGKPVGGPMRHEDGVTSAAFSPDGKTILTASTSEARLWDVPPLIADESERIRLWIEVLTCHYWDARDVVQKLSSVEWLARRRRLEELGGPPVPWR